MLKDSKDKTMVKHHLLDLSVFAQSHKILLIFKISIVLLKKNKDSLHFFIKFNYSFLNFIMCFHIFIVKTSIF